MTWMTLSAQLIYSSWKHSLTVQSSSLNLESIADIIYGFTVFIIGIEGGTLPLLFPFSVLSAITALILVWEKFKRLPVLTFFLVGYALAALIFTDWGIYWGSTPQFSHLDRILIFPSIEIKGL